MIIELIKQYYNSLVYNIIALPNSIFEVCVQRIVSLLLFVYIHDTDSN